MSLANLGVSQVLLLQLRLVLRLVAAEVLLLDLRSRAWTCLSETLMPVGRRALGRSACCSSTVIALLLSASYCVVPCFGNVLPRLCLACASSCVVVRFRDVRVADEGDIVGLQAAGAAARAAACNQRDGEQNREGELGEGPHKKAPAYAAWRAASIASTRSRAPANSPCLNDTSRFPVEYTAVSTEPRSSRSSPEPSTTGPTVARPPRKTR